jgi:SMI1-KNR4 cell-wall
MEINSFQISNHQIVDELEKKLNIELPKDYEDFLSKHNGAKILDGYFFVKGLNQEILMDVFFGVGLDERSLNLEFWHNELKDEIPKNSLLIGRDPGGSFILLINDGKDDGVYFYDDSYFFDQSSDENNTYFISKNFSLFLDMLEGK